ncbi:hypothetical protein MKW92_034233 [Papaver armeniacum]|nr:hypothetical protein MKW92_034233 [Papaver armeniacum]
MLTGIYKLPTDRLYVTYFGGDVKLELEADDEAKGYMAEILPPSRVLPFGHKDNFWEMGDTGPCGPCTEIHFDRIGNRDAASLVNNDDPTCIEIWNLHVDTGMGFERLTSILQNKRSNYDTDLFMPIFNAIQQVTGVPPYSGKVGVDDVDRIDTAYRVVADHIRTLCFAIADGSGPGNEGRKYVLRRILRRGMRYGRAILKCEKGFFAKLVRVVVESMGKIIEDEETRFGKTLLKGIKKFMEQAAQELNQGKRVLSGNDVFLLWDTYGFPLDLTQLMAEEKGLLVDIQGFESAMQEARNRSRSPQNKKIGGHDADATSEMHKMREADFVTT